MNSAAGVSLIVDSSVWIAYFRGVTTRQTELLNQATFHRLILVPDIVLAEVLQGIKHEGEYRQVRDALLEYRTVSLGGVDNALRAAAYYRRLRARGVTIRGIVDCLLAAFAIEHDCQVLHDDRDYDHFEQHLGLKVLHPLP